jgi:thiosulfate/3-mercaptopyruvate sulfurtransferase
LAKWVQEGRPVTAETIEPVPVQFVARENPGMLATAADVESMRMDPDRLLIDSRSPDRYRGENETIDPVAGHIPGARNRFFKRNVRDDGTMRTASDLGAEFREHLGEREPADAIVYCGSGVTACHNLLAMAHAGLEGAKLYAGSWSEWISDDRRPVAVGED